MDKNNWKFFQIITFPIVALISTSAFSHNGDDAIDAWYRSLHNNDGRHCCSPNRDCFPISEYHPSTVPGGFVVSLRNRSIEVPPEAVLKGVDNPTGMAVVCVGSINDPIPYVRCFIRSNEF